MAPKRKQQNKDTPATAPATTATTTTKAAAMPSTPSVSVVGVETKAAVASPAVITSSSSSSSVVRTCNAAGCTTPAGDASLKLCRCGIVSYCGASCQKRDWPTHKPSCTAKKVVASSAGKSAAAVTSSSSSTIGDVSSMVTWQPITLDAVATNNAFEWLRTSHGGGLYMTLQGLAWRLAKLDGNMGRHAIVVDQTRVQSMNDDAVETHVWPVYPLATLKSLTSTSASPSTSTATATAAAVTYAPLMDYVERMRPGVHMVILLLQSSSNVDVNITNPTTSSSNTSSTSSSSSSMINGGHIRLVLPAPERMDAFLAMMDEQRIPLLYQLLQHQQ